MTKREIAKRSLERKLKKRNLQLDRVWQGIVTDVNSYLEKNEPVGDIGEFRREVEGLVDDLCLSGAWVHDRLTGHSGLPERPTYHGSLSKKIRKALGYTY
jgi:hypothetical protein